METPFRAPSSARGSRPLAVTAAALIALVAVAPAGAAIIPAPVDLAVTAGVKPAIVQVGDTAYFSFMVENRGLIDATGVVLEINGLDGATSEDTRCGVGFAAGTLCFADRLAVGESTVFAFTLETRFGARVGAQASVTSFEPEGNEVDNTAAADAFVGQVLIQPDRLFRRAYWNVRPEGPSSETSVAPVPFRVVNDAPLSLGYDLQVIDGGRARSWARVTPTSGTIAPFDAQELTLHLLAPASPGLMRARLRFLHDSPFQVAEVPVSFISAFWDVSEEHPQDVAIHALAGAGVTSGCAVGYFCPEETLTRGPAAVWLLLAREGAAYRPPVAKGIYKDLGTTAFAAWAEELTLRGVTSGCGDENFCPDLPVLRAHGAVLLLRLMDGDQYVPPPAQGLYSDVPADDPFAPWIEEALRRELMATCTSGAATQFCPSEPWTRAQAAASLVKAFNIPQD